MADLQSKIGDGMSKIQGSIDQGKKKLKTAQEISGLEKDIQELTERRSKIIFQLGEERYKAHRSGRILQTLNGETAGQIRELDHAIYAARLAIQERRVNQQANVQCEKCGEALSEDDKFCGSCGTPVRQQEAVSSIRKPCASCHTEIDESAMFCVSCGTRQSLEVH